MTLSGYILHHLFLSTYTIVEELGSGGFGFVVKAVHNVSGREAAVKFVVKERVTRSGWIKRDERKVPMEAYLLRKLRHPGIVEFIDLFEDDVYFYLVMEYHGSPWTAKSKHENGATSPPSLPLLAASPNSSPKKPQPQPQHQEQPFFGSSFVDYAVPPTSPNGTTQYSYDAMPSSPPPVKDGATLLGIPRPPLATLRRSSCDLFECIEQHQMLDEARARLIFRQIVDVLCYLQELGVCHRDIKDENIVVDDEFNVKLIDFGSAVIFEPKKGSPYFNRFYGTTNFASAEIMRGEPYQAPPAEVWSLGVLLSILLNGETPFASAAHIQYGRMCQPRATLSREALDLMQGCLTVDIEKRLTVWQIRDHPWLKEREPLSTPRLGMTTPGTKSKFI
ncbi:Pkinase-domain-containing protein [Atractiella rhizophila]|nr:Pkinase-domain-containing protein [Atractiella rhizophila]